MAEDPRRGDTANKIDPAPAVVDPVRDVLSGGVRGEVAGCPTGLAGLDTPASGPASPDAEPGWEGGQAKPEVEPLEGRQEAARDS